MSIRSSRRGGGALEFGCTGNGGGAVRRWSGMSRIFKVFFAFDRRRFRMPAFSGRPVQPAVVGHELDDRGADRGPAEDPADVVAGQPWNHVIAVYVCVQLRTPEAGTTPDGVSRFRPCPQTEVRGRDGHGGDRRSTMASHGALSRRCSRSFACPDPDGVRRNQQSHESSHESNISTRLRQSGVVLAGRAGRPVGGHDTGADPGAPRHRRRAARGNWSRSISGKRVQRRRCAGAKDGAAARTRRIGTTTAVLRSQLHGEAGLAVGTSTRPRSRPSSPRTSAARRNYGDLHHRGCYGRVAAGQQLHRSCGGQWRCCGCRTRISRKYRFTS